MICAFSGTILTAALIRNESVVDLEVFIIGAQGQVADLSLFLMIKQNKLDDICH
jgi:hypothetical protein